MILDLADVEVLTLAARQVPFPSGVLHRWFPALPPRADIRWKYLRNQRALRRAVPVRPFNTPAVPLDRGEAEMVEGRMLPMSGIFWLLEDEQFRLDALRASSSDIAGSDAVLDVYAGDAISGAQRILQRVMLMQGESLSTGKIQIGSQSAPENRLQLPPIDWGIPTAHFFTAPILWNGSTPNILGQITTNGQVYTATNGGQAKPGVMLTSSRVLNTLVVDPELRSLFASLVGTPTGIGPAQVNQVLADRQLPRLVIDDTQVPDHTGTMRRQIPDNLVVFLPEDPALGGTAVGSTQWGLTQEARRLAQAQAISLENAPGIVAVPMQSENPVQDGTLVTGIGMPVMSDPGLVMTVQVLP
jgi:hypothetical protein